LIVRLTCSWTWWMKHGWQNEALWRLTSTTDGARQRLHFTGPHRR
jgi:hypothetical protein